MNTYMANKNSVFVDSNYFIALFNVSDSLHDQAGELAESMLKQDVSLCISNYIVLEVLTVLSQRVSRSAAKVAADSLSDGKQIEVMHISEELHNLSLQVFQTTEAKNISLVDCSILALLNYAGIKRLLTFDVTDFKPLRERFDFSFFQ